MSIPRCQPITVYGGACPQRTCDSCPDPITCAMLRTAIAEQQTMGDPEERDESTEGMLLEELLDQSTLDYITKVRGKQ